MGPIESEGKDTNLMGNLNVDLIEDCLCLSDQNIAEILNVIPRTIARWRAGDSRPRRSYREKLAQLTELGEDLLKMYPTAEGRKLWMNTVNIYLGEQTPLQVMRDGRIDQAIAALAVRTEGMFI